MQFVSTAGGVTGAGQVPGVVGTNGSEFTSDTFAAASGDALQFQFNYVTSDGAGFSDYAFAQLLTDLGTSVGYLFTARTQPSGDTSPGFGLPANISTLSPSSSAINAGASFFSPLGADSGQCYAAGCGSTGFIGSTYNIATAGNYKIKFGVTNVGDTAYNSALAFSGLKIGETPIGAVPEPSTWAMMLFGFGGMGVAMRRARRRSTKAVFA